VLVFAAAAALGLSLAAETDKTKRADKKEPRNLVVNGDFEDGKTTPTGWQTIDGLATFWVQDDDRKHGKVLKFDTDILQSQGYEWWVKIAKGAAPKDAPKKLPTKEPKYDTLAGNDGVWFWSDYIPVEEGKAYWLTIDVKGPGILTWLVGYREKGSTAFGSETGAFQDALKEAALKKPVEKKRGHDPFIHQYVWKGQMAAGGADEWKTYSRRKQPFRPTVSEGRPNGVKFVRVMIYPFWPPATYYVDNVKLVEWQDKDEKKATDKPRAPKEEKPDAAPVSPLRQAHAHNDYEHKRPLLDALEQGFCSVEADVFLVGDKLLVGHTPLDLRPERTLEKLYLAPLKERIQANDGRVYPDGPTVYLLIDVKTDAKATYAAVDKLLARYGDILSETREGEFQAGAVTVVISGNRDKETIARQKVRFAGIDGRPADLDSDAPAHQLPWISASWGSVFRWKGEGQMPQAERDKLKEFVVKAHKRGRLVRFWATPEKSEVWKELLAAEVDLINTDRLAELRRFLLDNAPARPKP
jgi:hypothetical protein